MAETGMVRCQVTEKPKLLLPSETQRTTSAPLGPMLFCPHVYIFHVCLLSTKCHVTKILVLDCVVVIWVKLPRGSTALPSLPLHAIWSLVEPFHFLFAEVPCFQANLW